MYSVLLIIHSLVRWIVLFSLLYAIHRAFRGLFRGPSFTRADHFTGKMVLTISLVQLALGLWLYFISPITNYFLSHYSDAVHQREIRFFGMEHSLMMVIAIVLIIIGSHKIKSSPTHSQKFKTMAIWFSIALVIILLSIPWAFSPFTSRPLLRTF